MVTFLLKGSILPFKFSLDSLLSSFDWRWFVVTTLGATGTVTVVNRNEVVTRDGILIEV